MPFYNDQVATLTSQFYRNTLRTERIIRVKRFIDEHYSAALTIRDLAAVACCSPYHFSREFKRLYGQSPVQYLTDKRMQAARALLGTNQSVTEACVAVGYASLGTFSMLVKKRTGQRPSALKRARSKK